LNNNKNSGFTGFGKTFLIYRCCKDFNLTECLTIFETE